MTPKTALNPKAVRDVINLKALYNEDTNKVLEQAAWEKEKSNFLINQATIAMVAEDTKLIKDELQMFNKAWNHSSAE